jgi:hypothetical protein
MSGAGVAVLFARGDSVYHSIAAADVFDVARDARTYAGSLPVVAHPPCRAWGRLRHFAKPRHDEKALALFAVEQVRRCGGVLEHPAQSTLWSAAGLPALGGGFDSFGGWTLGVKQFDFGHRADKATWLYIVGVQPGQVCRLPFELGYAPCVVETRKKDGYVRPSVSKKEREATPVAFAHWLIDLASLAGSKADLPELSDQAALAAANEPKDLAVQSGICAKGFPASNTSRSLPNWQDCLAVRGKN